MSKPKLKQIRLEEDVIEMIKAEKGELTYSKYLRTLLEDRDVGEISKQDYSDIYKIKKLCQLIAYEVSRQTPDLHEQIVAVYEP